MKSNAEKYHEIFIPEIDVYDLGGPEVFTDLERKEGTKNERNLVVIPERTFKKLQGYYVDGQSEGSKDVLKKISESAKHLLPADNSLLGVRIYRLLNGMDVAIMDERASESAGNNPANLEKMIMNSWSITRRPKKDINEDKARPTFISNNPGKQINLRNYGLNVEKPDFALVDHTIVNKGIIRGTEDFQLKMYSNKGTLSFDDAQAFFDDALFINQFIKLPGKEKIQYARVVADIVMKDGMYSDHGNVRVEMIPDKDYGKTFKIHQGINSPDVLGISPKDMEQFFALKYGILDPTVQVTFIAGGQGSGKTILAYAGAVDQVLFWPDNSRKHDSDQKKSRGVFDKLYILKSTDLLGGKDRDIGYLPGSMYQKLKPFLGSYKDAHEHPDSHLKKIAFEQMFLNPHFENEYGSRRIPNLVVKPGGGRLSPHHELVELTHTAYIRGRSIADSFIVIDEAQNLSPYELKTIIERASERSKVIVLGDPYQFDNPKCDKDRNGFTAAIKHFLPEPYTSLVRLTKNYRSPASNHARSMRVYSDT